MEIELTERLIPEAHFGPSPISLMELFAKIVLRLYKKRLIFNFPFTPQVQLFVNSTVQHTIID